MNIYSRHTKPARNVAKEDRKDCYGCIHLDAQPDAAGGGTYYCALYPCLVIGEWGHWTKASDVPKEVGGCWEWESNHSR